MTSGIRRPIVFASLVLMVLSGGTALTADDVPQTTPEGMVLRDHTDSRVVYAMPGATLKQYTKVVLLDCYVAFQKDWQKDYNRDAMINKRISADDMEKIKQRLADEFRKIFTEELETEGGYEIVDHTGDEVLVVRPAIINLEITAPDVDPGAYGRTIVESAGQMTLFLELYDSVTGAIIARVLDAEASDPHFAFEADRVHNKREADKILREWADALRSHLGTVKTMSGST